MKGNRGAASAQPRRAPAILLVALSCTLVIQGAEKHVVRDASNDFAEYARDRAIQLPMTGFANAEPRKPDLDALLKASKIVALGEPVHGAHEALRFRNELFRYLIEQGDVAAVTFETGMTDARKIDSYVRGQPGDINEVTQALTWGFGDYDENREFIAWLRQFNRPLSESKKIRFYGFDVSFGFDSRRTGPRRTVDAAIAYLESTEPQIIPPISPQLSSVLDRFTMPGYRGLTLEERAMLQSLIHNLEEILRKNRDSLIARTSREDYEWALQNVKAAEQAEHVIRLHPPEADFGTPHDLDKAHAARDAYMAANIHWIQSQTRNAGKVLIFAHNVHVSGEKVRGGIWRDYDHPPSPLGRHLKEEMGDDVLLLGMSAGDIQEMRPFQPKGNEYSSRPGSIDRALEATELDNVLIDLRRAKRNTPTWQWLNRSQTLRTNYTELELCLPSAFDVLVYVRKLTPAATLK